MTFVVLTFLGLVLGVALWCMWRACLTTTCISSLHVTYGYGAAMDGHALAGAWLAMMGLTFLLCMWWVESRLRLVGKEPPLP